MERRKASLLSAVLLCIFAVLTFMPITFLDYFAAPGSITGVYVIQKDRFTNLNFYVANIRGIAIITLIIAIIGIIVLFMVFSNKENKYTKYGLYIPLIVTVLFTIVCIYEFNHISPNGTIGVWPKGDRGYFGIRPLWGFYIELALLIASSVLSFLIATGRIPENENFEKNIDTIIEDKVLEIPVKESKELNKADELREMKKLLDEGIITEAEFEEKKKQLLGI